VAMKYSWEGLIELEFRGNDREAQRPIWKRWVVGRKQEGRRKGEKVKGASACSWSGVDAGREPI
jgi:hypothetical protein